MNKPCGRWAAGILVVVGVGVGGYFAQTARGSGPARTISPTPTPISSVTPGSVASSEVARSADNAVQVSPLTIKTLSGTTIAVPGAPVTVLYFMSAQCGSCVAGEQQLATLAPKLPATVRLISVDVTPQTDSPANVMAIAQSVGAQWPQAFASDAMLQDYRVTQLDQIAVVNHQGQILYDGALPPNTQLQQLISQAVKG